MDVVVHDEVQAQVEDELESLAKASIIAAAQFLEPDQVGEKLVYGNHSGTRLLKKLGEMGQQIDRLNHNVTGLKHEVTGLGHEVIGLKGQVAAHAQAIDGYMAIRNRFLDVFRRDKLGDADFRHTRGIRIGNDYAHGGDATTDAMLYQQGKRKDRNVFVALYGLSFSEVIELHAAKEVAGVIALINTYASLLARKDAGPLPEGLEAAFRRFVGELEANWSDQPDTTPGTTLGLLYSQFWVEHNRFTRC
ncbi:MAG: hypothetical protein M1832_001020 [Thelocarpon impressellum]|nr:MAG: hypothetical protein M1832_001020 [Thelocarpon impressellum]